MEARGRVARALAWVLLPAAAALGGCARGADEAAAPEAAVPAEGARLALAAGPGVRLTVLALPLPGGADRERSAPRGERDRALEELAAAAPPVAGFKA